MQSLTLIDKAFNGVEGYHHTTTETICSLIARGILNAQQAQACEIVTAFGHTYVIGQYEVKGA